MEASVEAVEVVEFVEACMEAASAHGSSGVMGTSTNFHAPFDGLVFRTLTLTLTPSYDRPSIGGHWVSSRPQGVG